MSVLLWILITQGPLRRVHSHGVNVDQQSRVIGLAHTSVL